MITQAHIETLIWSAATIVFIALGSFLVAHFARWFAGRVGLSQTEQSKVYWGFLFASPWIIGFVIFVLGPALASLYYSFTDYKLGQEAGWVGLENYRDLIQASGRDGRNFKRSMYNSLYYAIVGVPLQILAALGMALLLNTTVRGVRLFRLIFYMPVILAGGPAILLAWRYMLSSNGGFINETLIGFSEQFFLFDWFYRGFIFVAEGFNGFFIGLTNGNPTGPLNFFLPALIGAILTLMLLLGDWEAGKRELARRAVEIIVFAIGGLLVAVGIVAEPIAIHWTFIWGLLVLLGWYVNRQRGQILRARMWQIAGLGLIIVGFVLTSVTNPAPDAPDMRLGYLSAMAVSGAAIALTFAPKLNVRLLLAAAGVLGMLTLVQVAPEQFGAGKLGTLVQYLTFQSALDQPYTADYLNDGYMANSVESAWLFGVIVMVMLGVLWLDQRYPRVRQSLLIGALIVFSVIAISSAVDGVRYFQAYEQVAEETGRSTTHFARFREATDAIPEQNHRPKWLDSDLWAKPALILINMWSAGAGMLIFLAALKGVPQSLYEASKVDGASQLQRFFKITLPMISPAMFYNIVIGMIAALQTFEAVYILRTTTTETSLMSAAFYLYQRTFLEANIGEGSAISWLLAIIIVALTVFQFRYSNWVNYEV